MKKLLLASAIFLSAGVTPALAEKGHIADDVYVFMHGGPSNQYRITGRVRSGSAITIIGKSGNGKFVHVRTSGGKTGWVDSDNVDGGDSIQLRFPKLEAALAKSQTLVSSQSAEIQNLRAQLQTYKGENDTYSNQLASLQSEITRLNYQIDNMDESNLMRWFTYGALVAIGGVLLGLLVPFLPKKKKRRDDWL